MTGQLLDGSPRGHEVAAIYLRAPEEPPIDSALERDSRSRSRSSAARCAVAGRARRSTRRALGLAGGRPLWATDWRVRLQRGCGRSCGTGGRTSSRPSCASWASTSPASSDATVLVEHDPGAAAAADLAAWERGPRRARAPDRRRSPGAATSGGCWRRGGGRRLHRAGRGRPARARARRAVVGSRPGVALPPTPSDPVGHRPARALPGQLRHPPNVEAAIRLARHHALRARARARGRARDRRRRSSGRGAGLAGEAVW